MQGFVVERLVHRACTHLHENSTDFIRVTEFRDLWPPSRGRTSLHALV
jgi:hypothetical protein